MPTKARADRRALAADLLDCEMTPAMRVSFINLLPATVENKADIRNARSIREKCRFSDEEQSLYGSTPERPVDLLDYDDHKLLIVLSVNELEFARELIDELLRAKKLPAHQGFEDLWDALDELDAMVDGDEESDEEIQATTIERLRAELEALKIKVEVEDAPLEMIDRDKVEEAPLPVVIDLDEMETEDHD